MPGSTHTHTHSRRPSEVSGSLALKDNHRLLSLGQSLGIYRSHTRLKGFYL